MNKKVLLLEEINHILEAIVDEVLDFRDKMGIILTENLD